MHEQGGLDDVERLLPLNCSSDSVKMGEEPKAFHGGKACFGINVCIVINQDCYLKQFSQPLYFDSKELKEK